MNKIINSFNDALDIRSELAPTQTGGWHFLYRGHGRTAYKLLSMVGRKKPIVYDLLGSEQRCLNEFKDLVEVENLQQFKIKSYNDNMFYMSIGRHLGLDCRLLDWTAKLETALYFASSDTNSLEEEGLLWVMFYHKSIDDSGAKINPFTVNKFTLVKEDYWSKNDTSFNDQPLSIARRFSQNGFFTITPTSQLTIPLNELDIEDVHFMSFLITPNAKKDIMNHLHAYGDYLKLSASSRTEDDVKVINSKYFE